LDFEFHQRLIKLLLFIDYKVNLSHLFRNLLFHLLFLEFNLFKHLPPLKLAQLTQLWFQIDDSTVLLPFVTFVRVVLFEGLKARYFTAQLLQYVLLLFLLGLKT